MNPRILEIAARMSTAAPNAEQLIASLAASGEQSKTVAQLALEVQALKDLIVELHREINEPAVDLFSDEEERAFRKEFLTRVSGSTANALFERYDRTYMQELPKSIRVVVAATLQEYVRARFPHLTVPILWSGLVASQGYLGDVQ